MSDPTTCARCGRPTAPYGSVTPGVDACQAASVNEPEGADEIVECRDLELSNLQAHLRSKTRQLEECLETLTRARDELDRVLGSL